MNVEFYNPLGWMFVALATIFALGIIGPLTLRYYPGQTTLPHRLAAPVIFSVLAAACFAGIGKGALIFVASLGLALAIRRRWQLRNSRPAI